jgi:predicted nuclease with RNAse H fold
MRTVGVDLAAEPRKTAVAVIAWSEGTARVESLRLGVGNAEIVEVVCAAERAGIDSPFGWPEAFVRFLNEHDGDGLPVPHGLESRDGRRPLATRRTDLLVRASTGLSPLSVSADRIAHVAFRCAGLLAELRDSGVDAGRVSGRAVEVYPAAALLGWGLPARGYKGLVNRAALTELVAGFGEAAPWLDLGVAERLCRESDDAFDAVVAAVVARAVALGRTELPEDEDRAAAEREGWIHLPNSPLETLRGTRI